MRCVPSLKATNVGVELKGASGAELKGVAVCLDCERGAMGGERRRRGAKSFRIDVHDADAEPAYDKTRLSWTLIAASTLPPPLHAPRATSINRGRSLYASGPATRSARPSVSSSLCFRRSPMHPSTPTTGASIRAMISGWS